MKANIRYLVVWVGALFVCHVQALKPSDFFPSCSNSKCLKSTLSTFRDKGELLMTVQLGSSEQIIQLTISTNLNGIVVDSNEWKIKESNTKVQL